MTGTINLSEKLATFDQYWLPRTVALRVGEIAGLASVRLAIVIELVNSWTCREEGNARGHEATQFTRRIGASVQPLRLRNPAHCELLWWLWTIQGPWDRDRPQCPHFSAIEGAAPAG